MKTPRAPRWAWILIAVLVAVLGLWLAALAALPPSRLTPLVRDGLSRALHAPVALGEARLALDPLPSVVLSNLVVFDPVGYPRPAAWPKGGVAQARRVSASLDVWALFARRIAIRGAKLEDARVTAVRNEAGQGNWEGLFGPAAAKPEARPAFDVSLDRLRLERVRVSTYDARDGSWFEVQRLDGTVSYREEQGGRAQHVAAALRAQGLGGRTPWPIGDRPVELTADVDQDEAAQRVVIRRAGLRRGALSLTGHGVIEGPAQVLGFQLDQASVPLDAVLELLPKDQVKSLGDLAGKGDVRLALQAQGPLAHGQLPHVRARVALAGGRLAFRARSLAIEDLALDLAATESGATVNRLAGRVGRSVFELGGTIESWADPRMRLRLRANADLADVTRFLPLADSTRLAGRVDANAEAAGRLAAAASAGAGGTAAVGEAEAFGVSGQIGLHDVSASGVGLGQPVTGLNGAVGLLPGRAFAQGLVLRLGRSDLALDATIDRPWRFLDQLMNRAKRPDPAALARFTLRSRFLDAGPFLPRTTAPVPLPRVRAEGTVAIDSLVLPRLSASHVAGRVNYVDGVTELTDVALGAYGGTAQGQGRFDLGDVAHPRYTVHAAAVNLDANRLLSAWTQAKDVAFGTTSMTLDLDGAGLEPKAVAQSLTATGLAQIVGGKLAGANVFAALAEFTGVKRFRILSFRDLSAPFHVARGRVVFDPLALTTGGTDWLAQGSVGLDGTLDFHVAALVPPAEVPGLPAALTRTAGAMLDPGGRLTLDLALGGSVTRPAFAWDSKRTLSRLTAAGPAALEALTRRTGGTLADSLVRSQAGVEEKAQALVEQQKQSLADELARQKESLVQGAADQLDALFRRKSPPPPPPAESLAAGATAPRAPAAPGPATPDTAGKDSAR